MSEHQSSRNSSTLVVGPVEGQPPTPGSFVTYSWITSLGHDAALPGPTPERAWANVEAKIRDAFSDPEYLDEHASQEELDAAIRSELESFHIPRIEFFRSEVEAFRACISIDISIEALRERFARWRSAFAAPLYGTDPVWAWVEEQEAKANARGRETKTCERAAVWTSTHGEA